VILTILIIGSIRADATNCEDKLFDGVVGVIGFKCKNFINGNFEGTSCRCFSNDGPLFPFALFQPWGSFFAACACQGIFPFWPEVKDSYICTSSGGIMACDAETVVTDLISAGGFAEIAQVKKTFLGKFLVGGNRLNPPPPYDTNTAVLELFECKQDDGCTQDCTNGLPVWDCTQ
jgi:hypothetical protein